MRSADARQPCDDYSGPGIDGTMPGPGLFRVKRAQGSEEPVIAGLAHALGLVSPA